MPELGDTADPTALVPGDAAAVHETAWSLGVYADVLDEAAGGLGRISTPEGWAGTGAEEFRSAFTVQPPRWTAAAESHRSAADAVESYATTLEWAQRQAGEALRRWQEAEVASHTARTEYDRAATSPAAPPPPFVDPGATGRQAALSMLADARQQLQTAGDRAAAVVGAARDRAPEAPGFLSNAASGAGAAAAAVGNVAASLGNAALNHPLDVAAIAGGGALATVSAAGAVGSVALDLTGVGAVAGVPLGGASVAGVAAGVGIAATGAIDLALNAVGPDRVAPFQVNADTDAGPVDPPPFDPPGEITGMTKHGADQARARDGGLGVTDEAMADAVANPVKPPEYRPNGTYRYTGENAVVALNGRGEVVTTWATSSQGRRNK